MTDPTGAPAPCGDAVELRGDGRDAVRVAVAHERAKANERIAALGREIERARSDCDSLAERAVKAEAQVERLRATIDDLRDDLTAKVVNKEAEVERLTDLRERDGRSINDLTMQIERLRAELADEREHSQVLLAQRNGRQAQVERLRAALRVIAEGRDEDINANLRMTARDALRRRLDGET